MSTYTGLLPTQKKMKLLGAGVDVALPEEGGVQVLFSITISQECACAHAF